MSLLLKSVLKWSLFTVIIIVILYLLGPRVRFNDIDPTPIEFDIPLESIDSFIIDKEEEISDVKPGNQAQIIWADSTRSKTKFSVVYLHGFSASHEEGAPLHTEFASRYGANLYLARLYDHGRNTKDSFKGLLPEDLVNSAKEAIAIGKLLGDKVILMTCSTGGTLGSILAPYDEAIYSMFMYSPNIDLYDSSSDLIVGPWGQHLLDLIMGGKYHSIEYSDKAKQYWSEEYHTDGIVALKYLIKEEMTQPNFSKIDIPIYLGYYYKDEENQDKVVSVPRMFDFFNQINTKEEEKRLEAFPEAGRHVMTSHVFSKDINNVIGKSFEFAENVLGMTPK